MKDEIDLEILKERLQREQEKLRIKEEKERIREQIKELQKERRGWRFWT
jgi:hypothetical protein